MLRFLYKLLLLCASELSGGTLSYLIISLRPRAQNKLDCCHLKNKGNIDSVVHQRGRVSYTYIQFTYRQHIDSQLGKPCLISHEEKKTPRKVSQPLDPERELKIKLQRQGKLLKGPVPRLVINCLEM